MSIRLMSRVWESSFPPPQKMLLLALADCANDDGVCWPGVPHLARKCSVSERTVQRCLQDLIERGLIERRSRDGKACVYRVNMAAIIEHDRKTESPNPPTATPDNLSPVTICHPRQSAHQSAQNVTDPRHSYVTGRGDTAMSPEPSLEPSLTIKEPSRVPTRTPAREAGAATPEVPVRQEKAPHPACIPAENDRPFVKQARKMLVSCYDGAALSPPQRDWIRRAFKWTEQDLRKVEAQAREHINALSRACAVASRPAESLGL